jgi:hypothetical protein
MRYNKLLLLVSVSLILSGCANIPNDDFTVHYSSATQPRMQLGYINMPSCWWSCQISVNITDSEGRNAGGTVALSPSTRDNHSSTTSLSVGTGGGVPSISPSSRNGEQR